MTHPRRQRNGVGGSGGARSFGQDQVDLKIDTFGGANSPGVSLSSSLILVPANSLAAWGDIPSAKVEHCNRRRAAALEPQIMTVETVSLNRSHGGMQGVYRHASRETGTDMTFSVYVPPHQSEAKLPWSGICRPDLHPRQRHREGRISQGMRRTGFDLCRARHQPTRRRHARRSRQRLGFRARGWLLRRRHAAPFSHNYRMWSYVTEELPELFAGSFLPISNGNRSSATRWAVTAPSRSRCDIPALPCRQRLFADRGALAGAVGHQGARRLSRRQQGSMAQA